jgi:hypothetical protein
MERKTNSHIQLPKITNAPKQNSRIGENICENIYQKAYQTYLYNVLHDTTNQLCKNMFPIKLERSINFIK